MSRAEQLKKLFEVNHYAFQVNVKALRHEDSLVQPTPGGNCLNWVAGHIVASRNGVLALLGVEPVWSGEEAEAYKRGSRPIVNGARARPFESIVADFARAQERIRAGLDRIGEEALAAKRGEETAAEGLHFLQFHEAYHIGQIGLLRRIAGREGAIP